ncbi:cadherin-like beta sandwich domain-containing protein [Pseudoflavonifractor sp. An85]|uniref:cadherin-like beta sandwich domain-containing protein n=1 Tax=Pseudoflavonifractor sp. An85 TaxID=1965661 RepID=UPI001302C2FF|nr:cadherin-like beta sandwich domain-containing protein [Pseudoflavonifractor sp. An85]
MAGIVTVFAICMVMVSVLVAGFADNVRYGVITDTVVGLSVRSGPGTSYSRLGLIYDGTTVTIIGEKKASDGATWYAIDYNGGTGYVISTYVRIISSGLDDKEFEAYLKEQGFPESYWDGLKMLHAMYPEWVFKADHTGFDWDYAVDQESVIGKSLVQSTSKSSWKSTDPKAYNWDTGVWTVYDSGGWVAASREIVAYYMDPRNFLSQNSIFQFLLQSYDGNVQNVAGVERLVDGTFLDATVTDTDGKKIYYPQVIFDAGKKVGVNPYVLAAMIVQEQGVKGQSDSISGKAPGFEGYFNYYNIGAVAGGGNTAVKNGLIYAKGGSSGNGTSYGRPWDSRVKAITGGAQFYANGYVTAGQNTLYLKRFNVQGDNPFTHQYMTSVWGASSEGLSLAGGYSEELRQAPLVFSIPVYEDMPSTPCAAPTGDGSPDNRLSTLKVGNYTLTPGFNNDTANYSVVVPYSASSVTITATPKNSKAKVSGAGTVQLKVGSNTVKITVTAENGSQRTFTLTIAREADKGDFSINPKYKVSGANYVSGITVGTKVSDFVKNLNITGGYAQVKNASGSVNQDSAVVGTGDTVTIYYNNGTQYAKWTVLIYGDANGDGKIDNSDRVKIRNHVLGTSSLSGAMAVAADVNKDGQVNNTDRVKVRNHVLGTSLISQ